MQKTALEDGRRTRGDRRAAAMIESATELFMDHGFEGTSLDMVIERAGGSRRMIYERFENKEGLFVACVEVLLDSILGRLSALDFEDGDPEDALVEAGRSFVTALLSPDFMNAFAMIVAETKRFPELGRKFFELGPARAYARVSSYLERQSVIGRLRVSDPDLAGRQLVETMKGDLHLRALLCPDQSPDASEIERHVRHAVRLFLHGAGRHG